MTSSLTTFLTQYKGSQFFVDEMGMAYKMHSRKPAYRLSVRKHEKTKTVTRSKT